MTTVRKLQRWYSTGGLRAAILKFYRRLPFGAVFFVELLAVVAAFPDAYIV